MSEVNPVYLPEEERCPTCGGRKRLHRGCGETTPCGACLGTGRNVSEEDRRLWQQLGGLVVPE